MYLLKRKFFYVGEGETDSGAPPATPVTTPVTTPEDKELEGFTPEQQTKINAIVGSRVKKSKEETKKVIDQLQTIQQRATTTQADKDQLQKQIEELNKTLFTKEELAAQEKRELAEKHKTELDEKKKVAEGWQSRYFETLTIRALQDAAVTAEVFNPKQVVNLLKTKARVVESADANGKATGHFDVRISFDGIGSDGKPATLDLSPEDALKQMKAAPTEYGNLFKSGVTGGLGGSNAGQGNPDSVTVEQAKDTTYYMKNRKDIKAKLG